MKQILILFGGESSEHDVSCISARYICENLPKDKYEITTIGITKNGEWYLYDGDYSKMQNDGWHSDTLPKAIISPDKNDHGIIIFKKDSIEKKYIDVCFPVLHGKNGEDGTVQGLLELSGIAYVGCGVLSSACTMDKAFTNAIADIHKIPQAKWLSIEKSAFSKECKDFLKKAEKYLTFPIFVKPANAGSSVGISKVKNKDELQKGIEYAFQFDNKVVLEQEILGKEVECAVLGNEDPIASCPGEIKSANEFYDYEAKYLIDSNLIIPAELDEETSKKVQKAAIHAFKSLSCRGLSRCDFFITKNNEILLNEINTIPGFTTISMYPKLFESSGLPYSKLLENLINLAMENKNKDTK